MIHHVKILAKSLFPKISPVTADGNVLLIDLTCKATSHGFALNHRISMDNLDCILITDGPTERVLLQILTWLIQQHLPHVPVQACWADLRRLPNPPRRLPDRICKAVDLYDPCNLVFVHRDAEAMPLGTRQSEIEDHIRRASSEMDIPPTVPVVPVRMTEAWLLSDETAIREAAGNPNGTVELRLPRLSEIERIPDPKHVLHDLILEATELSARRKRRFDVNSAVLRIPTYTGDFSQLRVLSAFEALENKMIETIRKHGWDC